MLLKEKENLGFHTNQFIEAIFISSLQLFFFLPENVFILPYLLKDICMEYITIVARFVFFINVSYLLCVCVSLFLNWKITALQYCVGFCCTTTQIILYSQNYRVLWLTNSHK